MTMSSCFGATNSSALLSCKRKSSIGLLVASLFVLAGVAAAQVTVSPTSLTFADQVMGTQSGNMLVNATNTGTTNVTITQAVVSPSEFLLTSGNGGTLTIKPGAKVTYKVAFFPDSSTTFNGNLTLTISGSSPINVPLTGTGIPTLQITPATYNFGSITVGQMSTTKNFSLTNIGTKNVQINTETATPSEFVLTECQPTGLKPGATTFCQVQFDPDLAQVFQGTLTISLTNNTIPYTAALSGTGVATTAAVQVTPSSLSFPNLPLGTQSATQTVTIKSTGASAVTVQGPFVTPPFIVSGFTPPVVLQPGQSTTMQISLFGSFTGSDTGTLNIPFDVLDPSGVSLTGNVTTTKTLAVTTFPTLPLGTQTAPYLAKLKSAGGKGTITWSLTSGSTLPTGLKLSNTGFISGTLDASVAASTYTFTVQVTDSSTPPQTASELLTFTVMPETGANCSTTYTTIAGTNTPLVPLNDLGTGTYSGVMGGLYLNGSNTMPANHLADGIARGNAIQPLDANGNPDPNGLIVLLTLGISDTQQESIEFIKLASADPSTNPKLLIINGAIFGASAKDWADLGSSYWSTELTYILPNADVTANQVQAVWFQDLDAGPTGVYPKDMQQTQADFETVAQNLHTNFPNLQIEYTTGRIYGGYGNGVQTFDPEPYAYEDSLAVRGVIIDQLNGVPTLNYNAANGPVMAPWIAWGPYYWANGLQARSDGLTYSCQDLKKDGLHPEDPLGRQIVSTYLLNFMKTDPTAAPWFLAPASKVKTK